jgi:hypothetical protein
MVSVGADESLDESVSQLSEELETEASLFANTPDDLAEVMSERGRDLRKYRSFIVGSANASYPVLCCRSQSAPLREESARTDRS